MDSLPGNVSVSVPGKSPENFRFADRMANLQANVFADMDRAKRSAVVFG
jgi:hypothetical protein